MRPLMILFIAYTTLMCYYVSGLEVEVPAVYDRMLTCNPLTANADLPEEPSSVETLLCNAFKALYVCLTKPLDSPSDSRTEVLDFYRAYQLQRIFLANKKNLCEEELAYSELEKLVEESGIMEKENLPSIENEEYVPCAGDIGIECSKNATQAWSSGTDALSAFFVYTECYDNESAEKKMRLSHCTEDERHGTGIQGVSERKTLSVDRIP